MQAMSNSSSRTFAGDHPSPLSLSGIRTDPSQALLPIPTTSHPPSPEPEPDRDTAPHYRAQRFKVSNASNFSYSKRSTGDCREALTNFFYLATPSRYLHIFIFGTSKQPFPYPPSHPVMSLSTALLSSPAPELIATLDLEEHFEGGFFKQTEAIQDGELRS